MPECDGITATKRIRDIEQQKQHKKTPIIALTASVLQQDKLTAKQAGMNGFANKPVDIQQVNHEIAKVLGLEIKAISNQCTQLEKQHINYAKGIQMWGSKEKLNTEISAFLANHKNSVLRLKEATLDKKERQMILHTLKGVAGNLTLTNLVYLLSQVEKTIDHSQAQSQLAACETEWHTLLAMVEQTKDDNTDNQLDDEVAIDDFLPLIDTLQTQAQHAEIDDEQLSQVYALAPHRYKETVADICKHFDNFDFDAANTELASLKQSITEHKELS